MKRPCDSCYNLYVHPSACLEQCGKRTKMRKLNKIREFHDYIRDVINYEKKECKYYEKIKETK